MDFEDGAAARGRRGGVPERRNRVADGRPPRPADDAPAGRRRAAPRRAGPAPAAGGPGGPARLADQAARGRASTAAIAKEKEARDDRAVLGKAAA